MRAENLNDGTVKAVLILLLIAANIALSLFAPSPPARAGNHHVQTPQNEAYVARR